MARRFIKRKPTRRFKRRVAGRYRARRPSRKSFKALRNFPKVRKVVLIYANTESVSIDSANTGASLFFRANNAYDPDPRIGGSSAMDYLRYQQLYAKVIVKSAKIDFTLVTNVGENNSSGAMLFATRVDWDNLESRDKESIIAAPGTHHKYVPVDWSRTTRMSHKWSLKKTMGRNISLSDAGSNVDAQPALTAWFQLYYRKVGPFAIPATQVFVSYRISYLCEFSDIKDITQV